jgi:uncharacterized protein (DUF302 family)
MAHEGLVDVASSHSVPETVDRLIAAVTAAGQQVFAQVDHAAGAAAVGMTLRPTVVVLFGNPRGGTPLMMDRQSAGIDLPLKALVWEDADGQVWLTYNDARWIADRHGLGPASDAAVTTIDGALAHLAAQATG